MSKNADPYETILAEIAAAKAALSRATRLLEKMRPQPSLLNAKPKMANGHTDEFSVFYQVFPRHVGKDDALKAYERARKMASADEILEGAKRYAADRVGEDDKYTAHPSTWLNQGRWKDERSVQTVLAPVVDPNLVLLRQDGEARAAEIMRGRKK